MRIPVYDTPDVLPGSATPAVSNPGPGIGPALERLGQEGVVASGQVSDTMLRLKDQQDSVVAQNAYLDAATKASQGLYGQGGIATAQGVNAFGMGQRATDYMKGMLQDTTANLTDPVQQRIFQHLWTRHMVGQVEEISRREMYTRAQVQQQTGQAMISLAGSTAAQQADNPSVVLDQAQSAERAYEANNPGMSPEAMAAGKMAARSHVFQQAIYARAATDPVAAQQMFDSFKGQMDGQDIDRAGEFLKPKVVQARAAAIEHQIIGSVGGNDPDSVWGRMLGQESGGGNQFRSDGSTLVSSAGAIGAAQVMPATARQIAPAAGETYDETRLRTDRNYNLKLGRAYYDQQLQKFGNPAMAAAAYNAGPDRVDQWIQQNGDPRNPGTISMADWVSKIPISETRNYVQKVAPADAGTQGPPDLSSMIQRAQVMAGGDPEVERHAVAAVSSAYHQMQAATETERSNLALKLQDVKPALEAGADVPIPTTDIRRLLPSDKADRVISDLQLSQQAGQIYKSVQWADPASLQAVQQDLASGQGVYSDMIRAKGKSLTGPGLQEVSDNASGSDDPTLFGHRQRVLERFQALVQQRNQALATDPATYAAASPALKAQTAGLDLSKPADLRTYSAALIGEQRRLGVQNPRILSNDQVAQAVHQLTSTDPADGNSAQALDGLANKYGPDLWHQVFGELVDKGKLPGTFQTLATMTAPEQVAARADFQRALTETSKRGGLQELEKVAPPDVVKDINQNLDQQIDEFRQTARYNQGGIDLISNVKDSVKSLALYYGMQGRSNPLQSAADAILGSKYDFDGTMRVPKGTLPQVQSAIGAAQSGLRPDDLQLAGGNGALTQDDRQKLMADAVRGSGMWVPNRDDTGLRLMVPTKWGTPLPVYHRDNTPVEVLFGALPSGSQPRVIQANPVGQIPAMQP